MNERQRAAVAELVKVNRLQAEIIDTLFVELAQHISVEEAGRLPCLDSIYEAANIMKHYE